jgi:hypothetical protein
MQPFAIVPMNEFCHSVAECTVSDTRLEYCIGSKGEQALDAPMYISTSNEIIMEVITAAYPPECMRESGDEIREISGRLIFFSSSSSYPSVNAFSFQYSEVNHRAVFFNGCDFKTITILYLMPNPRTPLSQSCLPLPIQFCKLVLQPVEWLVQSEGERSEPDESLL